MLKLKIEETEYFNNSTNEFLVIPETVLKLEHSLHSVALWESKWGKPFLSKQKKTDEEIKDYVRCMLLEEVPYADLIISNLSYAQDSEIADYIEKPMTATWFSSLENEKSSRKVITAEIIYYWMISQNIPLECENWHLNKLLTLLQVCSRENAPKKKMSRSEEARSRSALNRARRMKTGSKG